MIVAEDAYQSPCNRRLVGSNGLKQPLLYWVERLGWFPKVQKATTKSA
jgi:hypothetical protein